MLEVFDERGEFALTETADGDVCVGFDCDVVYLHAHDFAAVGHEPLLGVSAIVDPDSLEAAVMRRVAKHHWSRPQEWIHDESSLAADKVPGELFFFIATVCRYAGHGISYLSMAWNESWLRVLCHCQISFWIIAPSKTGQLSPKLVVMYNNRHFLSIVLHCLPPFRAPDKRSAVLFSWCRSILKTLLQ